MTDFRSFPRLPVEVQLQIWETFLAMDFAKRPVVLLDDYDCVHPTEKLRSSALLLTNHQSNAVVHKFYPLTIPVMDSKSRKHCGSIRLNLDFDVFFFGGRRDFDEWTFTEAGEPEGKRSHTTLSKPSHLVTEPLEKSTLQLIKRGMEIDSVCIDDLKMGVDERHLYYEHSNFKGLVRCFTISDEICEHTTEQKYRDVRHLGTADYLRKYRDDVSIMDRSGGWLEEGRMSTREWSSVLDFENFDDLPTDEQIAESTCWGYT
ncbi:hypothetical protein GGR57DRAFT_468295 [Xylariaceae sp. FL1272]|nr:hypothetical protein GGR57DRAFT_468295 [Xylariaceae sp. FL1272]